MAYLFPSNKSQLRHNYEALPLGGQPIVVCKATHTGAGSARDPRGVTRSYHVIPLAVGAPVMLIHNLLTEKGLANGSLGVVIGIIFPEGPPRCPNAISVSNHDS